MGSDSDNESDASNMRDIIQGDDPLVVNSESELKEEIDMPYDEFASFCQKFLEKYDLLKIENGKLKKENSSLIKENNSFKNKFECVSKENEFLKKENISLSSKLNDIYEKINSLKN